MVRSSLNTCPRWGRSSVWESACLADKRSGVRSSSSPPCKPLDVTYFHLTDGAFYSCAVCICAILVLFAAVRLQKLRFFPRKPSSHTGTGGRADSHKPRELDARNRKREVLKVVHQKRCLFTTLFPHLQRVENLKSSA